MWQRTGCHRRMARSTSSHARWARMLVASRTVRTESPTASGSPQATRFSSATGRCLSATITRLRRADVDTIPEYSTPIEVGDHLRVVMPTEKAQEVSRFFGDSERAVSEFDYAALALGIAIGVLIGMIPLPFPGAGGVSLGFAGGPLVVGLVLGKLGRSGQFIWTLACFSRIPDSSA